MNESGRHSQGSGGAGASVESILDAIEFQSAILTLNAAVEAAHIAGPTAPTSRAPSPVKQATGREDGNRREARPAPSQAGGLPETPGGSAPLPGCCAASAADSGAEARWQRSLERLQQSLAAACGADRSNGADGRRQTGTAPPRATAAPDAVPILRRRRRSTPAQFGPPHPFQGGTS
jgi:hypothetical protein